MNDPTGFLIEAMAAHGLRPQAIKWDGKPHLFPGIGQNGRGDNGWYIAQQHQRIAHFGDHAKLDTTEWRNGKAADRSPEEIERDRAVAVRRAKDDDAPRKRQVKALRTAFEAAGAASPDHPYIVAKGVQGAPLDGHNAST